MIEANELRLGNLIRYNYDVGNNESRFDHVDIDMLDDILAGNNLFYEPIPLTPEILIAAGFKKIEKHGGCYCLSDVYLIYNSKEHCLTAKYKSVFITAADPYYPTYLHQLQNLYFALTGKEIEVNLLAPVTT